MGMVKLMKDQESMESPLYDVIMYGAADEIVPLLTKGELDAAAIPGQPGRPPCTRKPRARFRWPR